MAEATNPAIEDYYVEDRTFPPPDDFKERSLVASPFLYDEAAEDDEGGSADRVCPVGEGDVEVWEEQPATFTVAVLHDLHARTAVLSDAWNASGPHGATAHSVQTRVVAGSRVDLVRSGVAVAVRAGAPVPDIASEDALRRAGLGSMMGEDCTAGDCARLSWEQSRGELDSSVAFTSVFSRRDGIPRREFAAMPARSGLHADVHADERSARDVVRLRRSVRHHHVVGGRALELEEKSKTGEP